METKWELIVRLINPESDLGKYYYKVHMNRLTIPVQGQHPHNQNLLTVKRLDVHNLISE